MSGVSGPVSGLPPESVPGTSAGRTTGAGTSELSVSSAVGHRTASAAGTAGAAGGTVMAIVGRSSGRAGTAERS